MLLTEKETRKLECRAGGMFPMGYYGGSNPPGETGMFPRCSASGCMAWQWRGYTRDEQGKLDRQNMERIGYCGLAGKSEE